MAFTSNYKNAGVDLGAVTSLLLEPKPSALTQAATSNYKSAGAKFSTLFLLKSNVTSEWIAYGITTGYKNAGVDLGAATTGLFQAKGYAPATTVRITYTGGTAADTTGNFSSPTVLRDVAGGDSLDFIPKSFNAFIVGSGGGGGAGTGNGTTTNGGGGGGGGSGASVLFSADWPIISGSYTPIYYVAGKRSAAQTDGVTSQLYYTVSAVNKIMNATGGKKGVNGTAGTSGAGGAGGAANSAPTQTWTNAGNSTVVWSVTSNGFAGGNGGAGGGAGNNGSQGTRSTTAACPFKLKLIDDGSTNGLSYFEKIIAASSSYQIHYNDALNSTGGAYNAGTYPTLLKSGGGGGGAGSHWNGATAYGGNGNNGNYSGAGAGGGAGGCLSTQTGGLGGPGQTSIFY